VADATIVKNARRGSSISRPGRSKMMADSTTQYLGSNGFPDVSYGGRILMNAATDSSEVSELESRHKSLVSRREALKGDVTTLEAELAARRRRLRALMDEAESEGFDPNNIKEEIRKATEVVRVKLDGFEADIEAGEKMVQPMLDEVKKG
jgi:hypothetical protein